ncbi:MAG TPA: DUF2934 domain-containing protein [Candidatus Acidoferrum sp.]|nr:DUF2934 domain-containing protein [Candidatus Acidoferrum sp.]
MPKADITSKPKVRKSGKAKAPTKEEIALRAYHIYLERKGAPGDPHADWLRAERELLAEARKEPIARKKSNVRFIAA